MYTYSEARNSSNALLKKEDYFDLEKDDILDLQKLIKLFMGQKNKNEFYLQVLAEDIDGEVIVFDFDHKLTIMIRVDNTHRVPKSA